MKHKFLAELSRRLAERGIESVSKERAQLEIILHAQPVLYVSPGNDVFLLPAGSNNEEAYELYHQVAVVADEVYEYVEAVKGAPILHASAWTRNSTCWRISAEQCWPGESGKTARATNLSPGSGTMAGGASATVTTTREISKAPSRTLLSAPD